MEYQTPKTVDIRKETFTIQEATTQVTQRLQKHESFNFLVYLILLNHWKW